MNEKESAMVKFINRLTGSEMWVAEDRVEEYKAAGHKPAATDAKPAELPKQQPKSTKKKR